MSYIGPDELAALMKQPDKVPRKDYVVVDVRDNDRVGGHIKDSVNQPSQEFLQSVDSLVSKTKDVPLVIFHCAYSQTRGPRMAQIYEDVRKHNLSNDIKHEVVVLRQGFAGFQLKYKDDPELVEGWDATVWANAFD